MFNPRKFRAVFVLWMLTAITIGALWPVSGQADCTEPDRFYVSMFFGEKSGSDQGFEAYGVADRLAGEGFHFFTCNGEHLVGPFNSGEEAQAALNRIEQIALDNTWLHFYSSVVVGAAAPAPTSVGAPPSGVAPEASPLDAFLGKVKYHAGVLILILVLDLILSVLITRLVLRLMGFSTSLAVMVIIFLVTPLLHHCSHIVPGVGFLVSTIGLIILYGYLFRKTSTGKPVGCVTGLLLLFVRMFIHYVILIVGLVVFAGQLMADFKSMF